MHRFVGDGKTCVGKTKEFMMPGNYMEMTEKEMEYDGGWLNFVVAAVATVGGLACTALTHSGVIKDEKIRNIVNAIGIGCTIVGLASLTCGVYTAATATTYTATQGARLIWGVTSTPISILSFLR